MLKKLSEVFVKFIIIIAVITLAVWLAVAALYPESLDVTCVWCFPFERFISVLVASCPCALGLAIPSVMSRSLNMGMKQSILIKKTNVFEKISKIKAIVFDKTGTLFTRASKIDEFTNLTTTGAAIKLSDNFIWSAIHLAEKNVKHPIAELLCKEAIQRDNATDIESSDTPSSSKTASSAPVSLALVKKEQLKNGIAADIVNSTDSSTFTLLLGNLHLMKSKGVNVPSAFEEEVI